MYIIINIYITLSFSSSMKYAQNPKPIEYDPLTKGLLESQETLEPVYFSITPESHGKTLALLNANTSEEPITLDTLLPSEMWGLARVLSNHFGRLNEVAVSRTKWEISNRSWPGYRMKASSRLIKTETRKGLSFALVETETRGMRSELLMYQLDELMLLHGAPEGFYFEREIVDNLDPNFVVSREVYFRHKWDPTIWKNNVHTDDYAKRFGYEKGLPEFIMYMDCIFDAVYRREQERVNRSVIEVPLILPIYEHDKIEVKLRENLAGYDIRFVKDKVLRLKGSVYFR